MRRKRPTNIFSCINQRETCGTASSGSLRRAGGNHSTKQLQQWLEADFLQCCSAQYCDLSANSRSTIAAAFNADGSLLASTHGDHTVKIISSCTGKCIRLLRGHRRTPWVVRFHPKAPHLMASGSLDNEVRIWNVHTGDCLASNDFGRPIASLAFSCDGSQLAVASGHKLYIWQYSTSATPPTLPSLDPPTLPIAILKTRRSLRAVQFHALGTGLMLTAELHEANLLTDTLPPASIDLHPHRARGAGGADASWSCRAAAPSPTPPPATSGPGAAGGSSNIGAGSSTGGGAGSVSSFTASTMCAAAGSVGSAQLDASRGAPPASTGRGARSALSHSLARSFGTTPPAAPPAPATPTPSSGPSISSMSRLALSEQPPQDPSPPSAAPRPAPHNWNVADTPHTPTLRRSSTVPIRPSHPTPPSHSTHPILGPHDIIYPPPRPTPSSHPHPSGRDPISRSLDSGPTLAALYRPWFTSSPTQTAPPSHYASQDPTAHAVQISSSPHNLHTSYAVGSSPPVHHPSPFFHLPSRASPHLSSPHLALPPRHPIPSHHPLTLPPQLQPPPAAPHAGPNPPTYAPPPYHLSSSLPLAHPLIPLGCNFPWPWEVHSVPPDHSHPHAHPHATPTHPHHHPHTPASPPTNPPAATVMLTQDQPSISKLRLFKTDPSHPRRLTDPPLLSISHAVLCSEMGAHLSPCGRYLAACVACSPTPRPAPPPPQPPHPPHLPAPPAPPVTRNIIYELRVYSLMPATFGAVHASRPIKAAQCLTSLQFSPTSEHLLLAYGRRHLSLCSLVADGHSVTPVHTVIDIYRVSDMALVRVLPSADDEVNVATFHPAAGGGIVYGTKEGRLRILRHDRTPPAAPPADPGALKRMGQELEEEEEGYSSDEDEAGASDGDGGDVGLGGLGGLLWGL